MPGAALDQDLVEKADLVRHEDAEPQVVVLARAHRFVETSERAKERRAHHHGRRADEAGAQRIKEDIAAALEMTPARIDAPSAANPSFLALRDLALRMRAHEIQLALELVGHPDVVGIQKCDQRRIRERNAVIARRRSPAIFDALDAQRSACSSLIRTRSSAVPSVEPSSITISSKCAPR